MKGEYRTVTVPSRSISPSDEYFAGFFDGEGSVGCYGPYRQLTTQTVNTNRLVIDLLLARFGGFVVARKLKSAHHKQAYCHVTSGGRAYELLIALRPHLVVKADRVDEILAEWKLRPPVLRGPSTKKCCIHGHLLDEGNTRINGRGTRTCRTCDRLRQQRRREESRRG